MSVLTLIRAKEEDSGNYTMRVENGDQVRTVGLILEVKGQRRMPQAPYCFYFLSQPRSPSFSLSLSNILTHTFAFPPSAYSACSHCGPDGHPPWLSHRPVCGVHY